MTQIDTEDLPQLGQSMPFAESLGIHHHRRAERPLRREGPPGRPGHPVAGRAQVRSRDGIVARVRSASLGLGWERPRVGHAARNPCLELVICEHGVRIDA